MPFGKTVWIFAGNRWIQLATKNYVDQALAGGIGSISGIQGNTYPQDVDYLYVHSSSFSGSSIGAGIELVDTGGGGVYISSDEGGIRIESHETGEIRLKSRNDIYIQTLDNSGEIGILSNGNIQIKSDTGGIEIEADDGGNLDLLAFDGGRIRHQTDGGVVDIYPAGGSFFVQDLSGSGTHELRIGGSGSDGVYMASTQKDLTFNIGSSGKKFQITDPFGNPILQVFDDGSVHGLASVGGIVWDL